MKKRMLSRVGFTIIAVASLFLASHGYAYDMADYYPLEQGFTWTMQSTWNDDPTSYEDTTTIDGFEDVGGVTTAKWVDDDGGYTCLAFDSEVLGIYKSADDTHDIYITFTPPAALLPAEAEIGQTKSYSSNYTVYINDNPLGTGTFVNAYQLVSVEDVSVPAGDFSGCLRFSYSIVDTKTSGPDLGSRDETYGTFWLAPDVGMVKSQFVQREYEDNVLVEESSVVRVLSSYDRGGGGGGDDGGGCFISAACGFPMAR